MNLSEAILLYQQMCTEGREKRSRLPILGEPPCEKCAVYVAINAMKKELKREAEKKNDEYLRRRAAQEEERRRGCWWCNGIGATPENWECSLVGEFGTVTTTDNEVVWTTASFCPSCGRRLKENEDG